MKYPEKEKDVLALPDRIPAAPWSLHYVPGRDPTDIFICDVEKKPIALICDTSGSMGGDEEHLAVAAFFQSAPQLYDALEKALPILEKTIDGDGTPVAIAVSLAYEALSLARRHIPYVGNPVRSPFPTCDWAIARVRDGQTTYYRPAPPTKDGQKKIDPPPPEWVSDLRLATHFTFGNARSRLQPIQRADAYACVFPHASVFFLTRVFLPMNYGETLSEGEKK